MLRRASRNTLAVAASAALAVWLGGCLKNVPQDANTGKDGRYKGAKTIELEGGEARVRDIVTYPGGDRVDWKVFEIPEGSQGDMKIKLKWRPARPGMDLAFSVYDQWFHRIGAAKPDKKGRTRTKRVKLKRLKPGKYYVQVYASTRMDAGRYTLSLRFKERTPPKMPTVEELAGRIEDPPSLPAVVEPKEKTPEELAAEQAEKDRLAAEQAEKDAQAQADKDRLDALMKPVFAKIRRTQKSTGGGVIITINVGRNKEIDKDWKGSLLRGSSKDPLPDGDFKVIRVTETECVAKVKLSLDQVKANPNVVLQRSGAE